MVRKSPDQPFWVWPAVAVVAAIGVSVAVLMPLLPTIPGMPEGGSVLHNGVEALPAAQRTGGPPGT
jgi:hypothetical protein